MTPEDLPDDFPPPEQKPDEYHDPFAPQENPVAGESADSPALDDPFAITPSSDGDALPIEGDIAQNWDSSTENPQDPFADSPSPEASSDLEAPAAVATAGPLEKIKDFSEKVGAAQAIPAAFPFSLLIEGPLSDYEKEKLLDLLSRENMGIREVDLEPQFVSQRILIPRISEYAGILLVQVLRGTRAKLRLGPSDQIFTTEDTRDPETQEEHFSTASIRVRPTQGTKRAEQVRISADPTIPDLPGVSLLDLVMASATLEADTVEAQDSPEYQEVMDALIRELKYKAFRKGALAIVNFSFELVSLSLPSQYRITVSGYAVGTSNT